MESEASAVETPAALLRQLAVELDKLSEHHGTFTREVLSQLAASYRTRAIQREQADPEPVDEAYVRLFLVLAEVRDAVRLHGAGSMRSVLGGLGRILDAYEQTRPGVRSS